MNDLDLQTEADTWHLDNQQPSEGVSLGAIHGTNRKVAAAGHTQAEGVMVDENTLYEIGSITKVFTGILLADTVLSGKATLNDSIDLHLPPETLPSDSPLHEVTLLQLATHTSGLPRLPADLAMGIDPEDPYAHYSRARLFAYLSGFQETELETPGTYAYSNLGFGLLGELLSLIHGKPYADLLATRVLQPLEMGSTWVQVDENSTPDALASRFAVGHLGGEPTAYWRMNAFAGTGSIVSSVADMLKFIEAHWSENTPSGLQAAMALAAERHTGRVGLGWHFQDEALTHDGGTGGFRSSISLDPAQRMGRISLRNSSGKATTFEKEGFFEPLVGYWSGTLTAGSTQLRLVMRVTPEGQADMYSLDQGGLVIPSSSSRFLENQLQVEFPTVQGTFTAELMNNELVGTWKQGSDLPLTMQFSKTMPKTLATIFESGYEGDLHPLKGFWSGNIGGKGGLFVYLELREIGPYLEALLWSPSQSPFPIGINRMRLKDNRFSFSSDVIGGRYEGTVDLVNNQITGTWTQGIKSPLNLTGTPGRPDNP